MKGVKPTIALLAVLVVGAAVLTQCARQDGTNTVLENAASKVYVAPGEYDEFYAFMSGGFSGQVTCYGLPSGRLFRTIPVFSVNPENGWGFTEETKAMLNTSHGFVPWDDSHHPEISQTDGAPDGRWLFINANNTPRVARIDLSTFETDEIIEIPNSGGNHASPFCTMNTEYVVAATRFSVPIPQKDVPIDDYKKEFKGTLSFIKVDPNSGHMNIAFQILVPGYDYDLSHSGKGKSHGWSFFTCYNSEQANTLLEVNASKRDKDFIAAVNWQLAEKYVAEGKARTMPTEYAHNHIEAGSRIAKTETIKSVKVLDPSDCPGMIYYLPTPKSPHGVDVDPTGEYIAAGGKLATVIPVHSFTKMLQAIENKEFEGARYRIPVWDRCTPSLMARATPTPRRLSHLRSSSGSSAPGRSSTGSLRTTRSVT
jgi:nitrous-oxide reductase